MRQVVRESKFRHVHGDGLKTRYEDCRLSSKATESTGIRGNSKFLAFSWESGGGGSLAVVPMSRHGRLSRDMPLLTGHSGPILDFEFNPFDENMIITASEDLSMKIWSIPDGGLTAHMKEPTAQLDGHGKKVSFCTFHPAAASIVASTSFDGTVKVWNLDELAESFSIPIADQALSLKWNYSGSLLAATCKDKMMRIIDPRVSKIVAECRIHDGVKASKVEWLGGPSTTDDCHKLITTGFSSQAERQLGIWDMRTFSSTEEPTEPVNMILLDQGTGALYPFFDPSTQMLYLAGKGDANVRFFEFTAEDPYLHYISDYRSTVPQKGFCFLPKRCVDVGCHEVMRGLKLEASAIQPVSFKVPRKSDAFQDDLYPDCPASVPAMTPDQWVSTEESRPPVLQSMRPGEAEAGSPMARGGAGGFGGIVSVKDLKKQLAEAEAKISALEAENSALKAELTQLKGT